MPAPGQRAGRDDDDRPTFTSQHGRDAARFLDQPLVRGNPAGVSEPGEVIRARIEGIDRLAVINAWKAVERALGRGDDGGPRTRVMDWLHQRERSLHAEGERPDDLPADDGPARYQRREIADIDTGEPTFRLDGEVVERGTSASAKLSQLRSDDANDDDAVRADGGSE